MLVVGTIVRIAFLIVYTVRRDCDEAVTSDDDDAVVVIVTAVVACEGWSEPEYRQPDKCYTHHKAARAINHYVFFLLG